MAAAGVCGWAQRQRCRFLLSWHLLTKSSNRLLMTGLKHMEQPVEQSYQHVAFAYHAAHCRRAFLCGCSPAAHHTRVCINRCGDTYSSKKAALEHFKPYIIRHILCTEEAASNTPKEWIMNSSFRQKHLWGSNCIYSTSKLNVFL